MSRFAGLPFGQQTAATCVPRRTYRTPAPITRHFAVQKRVRPSAVSFRHQKKRDFFGNKHMSKMQPDAGQWLPAGVSRVPVQVGLHGSESVLILLDARG
jgi:hypothetical protein